MGAVIVVSGPSGIGKSFLASYLQENGFPIKPIKLVTTRKARKGETPVDRVFVSVNEFKRRQNNGEFLFSDKYHENYYGYPKNEILNQELPVLLNTWPDLLPKFKNVNNVVMVGLTAKGQTISVLEQRVKDRGESEHIASGRIAHIKKDIDSITKQASLINEYGKVFFVENNETIPSHVVPWLAERLGNTS